MAVRLEPAIEIGGYRFAALCEVEVSARCVRDTVMASARKAAIAVLIRTPTGVTSAIRADGKPVGADWVEGRCPGAWSRFEAGESGERDTARQ